ncbi:3'-5' exonuclease [Thermosporothrix hazakensis]|jgi:DNA polymerase I-like protein with 3'-5' exonuclease and polymerase domains|uniref:DNA polymerase I n=1 Tax=Thermosporothrix hazakensis TaxID=644383 RepID=A0A326TT35_THEHA|nr:3'-5' exonuclease [Thermosporothrix hazakensis]GCE45156.1 hypothetical protein KTH_00250 [Thermosporothrix hazakensis]
MRISDKVQDLIGFVNACPPGNLAVDTETTGLSWLDDRLVAIQLKAFGGAGLICDVRHWGPRDWELAAPWLQGLFDEHCAVLANAQFDWKFLRSKNVTINRCYDVLVADQVIRGLGKTGGKALGISFDLKSVAARYGVQLEKDTREVFVEMDRRPEWHKPFSARLVQYMVQDVEVLEVVFLKQQEEINKRQLREVVELESRAIPAIASIEFNGIRINQGQWEQFIQQKAAEARMLEQQAIEEIGLIVAKIRAKKYRQAARLYKEWQQARDEEEARVRAAWDELPEAEKVGITYQSWKKEKMAPWRAAHPNPGVPKYESFSGDAWEAERAKVAAKAVKQGTQAHTFIKEWEKSNPRPALGMVEPGVPELRRQCYTPINLNSPKQLLEVFRELDIPLDSTSKEVLEKIPRGVYPLVDLLLAYRQAEVFPTKFGEKLLRSIHPKTGRIHPVYLPIGADTGRMLCSNPP